MEYEFTLKFKLGRSMPTDDEIMNSLASADCTDAFIGLGLPGYVSLEFTREAQSAEEAILSAVRDAQRGLPGAQLIEAGPDFVNLTDVANMLGMSRQNMRKLFEKHSVVFPAPVHAGTTVVWHLAPVLMFLKERHYVVAPTVWDVAWTAMHINSAREKVLIEPGLAERVQSRLAEFCEGWNIQTH
ncbi:DNA-binding protein [Variovorax defluvii]|uniref:DNA-binding protein n=1 Tax=Variovorax defluvii TaxID=913761 RepID=A0ABP8IBX6_9BURK